MGKAHAEPDRPEGRLTVDSLLSPNASDMTRDGHIDVARSAIIKGDVPSHGRRAGHYRRRPINVA